MKGTSQRSGINTNTSTNFTKSQTQDTGVNEQLDMLKARFN